MRQIRRNRRRVWMKQDAAAAAGGNSITSDPNPISNQLTFWTEPTMANPETDAKGATTFTTQGSPALSGTSGPAGQAMLDLDGSSWLNTATTGNGLSTITSSFWVYALINVPSLANQSLGGNGGTGASDNGWYAYVRSDGRLRIGVSDGTTDIQSNIGTTDAHFAANENNAWLIQFNLETPGSEFIRVHPNGFTDLQGSFDLDISSLTFPITAANDFAVGNRRGGASSNLPLTGDIMLTMGQGIISEEQKAFLFNDFRGRTYTDANGKTNLDFIKYVQAGIPETNKFFFSARTDRTIVPKVYDSAGTLVATGGSVTPSNGYANSTVTGTFTAGQRYEIRYEDLETSMVSLHCNHVWALPTDNDFDIFSFADWDPKETDARLIYKIPINKFQSDTKPTYGIMAGDLTYANNTTNTVAAFRDNLDSEFDFANAWNILRWLPFNDIFSDHDGPWVNSGGVDADETSAVLTAAQDFWHARSPIGDRAEQSSGRINWSISINNLRIIATDLRSERNEVGLVMTSSGVGSTQEWFSDELDAAITNNQVILWMSEVIFDSGGADDQSWTLYSQRADYFNEIAGKSTDLTLSGMTYCADAHQYSIDDGANQGSFDTNSFVKWPSMASGPFNHGTRVTEGTWNQQAATGYSSGVFGLYEIRDEAVASIEVTMKAISNQLSQLGSSYTTRLTKPGISSGRVNDDFRLNSAGAGVPTGWTSSGDDTNMSYSIVADAGSPGGNNFQMEKTTGDTTHAIITIDASDGDDVSAVAMGEGTANARLGVVANWDTVNESGYLIEASIDGNLVQLWEANSGVYTSLDSVAKTLNAATEYNIRLVVKDNGEVRGRVWENGDLEPADWDVEVTGETTHTSGEAGVHGFANGGTYTINFHKFSAGLDGNQGCLIHDHEWPSKGLMFVTLQDDGIRLVSEDGTTVETVHIDYVGARLEGITKRVATKEFFFTDNDNNSILKVDEFGMGRTLITSSATDCNTITANEDDGKLYYNVRVATNGTLVELDFDGSNLATLVSSINWASEVYYNEDDGLIYISALNTGKSYNTSGVLQVTFGSDTNQISMIADATHIYQGSFSGGTLLQELVGGGSQTTADNSAPNIWGLGFNKEKTQLYATGFSTDGIDKWDSMPPTHLNRTQIVSPSDNLNGIALEHFDFY